MTFKESNSSIPKTIINRLGGIGGAVFELFVDKDIRKKAHGIVLSEASRKLKELQEGVLSKAETLQKGPHHLQRIYTDIQRQYQEYRLQGALKAKRDAPVDVQLGPCLWEDAPQDLRSRLWITLLDNRNLTGSVRKSTKECLNLGELYPVSSYEIDNSLAVQKFNKAHPNEGVAGLSHVAESSLKLGEQHVDIIKNGNVEDAWEVLQPSRVHGSHEKIVSNASLRDACTGQEKTLKEAMCNANHPIPHAYPEGCRYDTLCQISVGQEEVEEIIRRDINRTFPEHPQFNYEEAQQELFRVLKAFSLHDLEAGLINLIAFLRLFDVAFKVGYCQGMAFVAGIILMYLPEEPAFRMLARMLDESGPNLRQLYLPGLDGLKHFLRIYEWSLQELMPNIKIHLEEFGVVPVLYVSQWFLTVFSCPFPASFACRIMDILLIENKADILLLAALAVVSECESSLLQLNNFEDIVTYLKVEPVKWSTQKVRDVINKALDGSIDHEIIALAESKVQSGYLGSLTK